MNSPRAYFSLLTIGDAFVAIGGVTNDGYTTEVEAFFNYTKSWTSQHLDLHLDKARSSFATLLLPPPVDRSEPAGEFFCDIIKPKLSLSTFRLAAIFWRQCPAKRRSPVLHRVSQLCCSLSGRLQRARPGWSPPAPHHFSHSRTNSSDRCLRRKF